MRGLIVVVLAACLSSACTSVKRTSGGIDEKQTPAEVNTQLGIEYMRKGMYEASLEKFQKAIQQDPGLQTAHSSVAILYEQLGEKELADKHYRRAYNLNRSDPVTLNNYGQFLCRNGRLKEADSMFMKAVKDPLYRHPEMIYTNAGICAQKQPDQELAEKYYRQALERNARYQPALTHMVRISFAQGKHLAARAYLQRLQEQAPLSPEMLWIGVRTEAELGDRNAVASYSLVLKNRYPASEQTQALAEWERARRGP